MMFTFQWPGFILLLPLPWLVNYLLRNRQVVVEKPVVWFPRIARLKAAVAGANYTNNSPKLIKIVWWLCWLLLIVVLMRPELVGDPKPTSQYGYDLMLAVDLSPSMKALDFSENSKRVTRLHAVKQVVDKFVKQRQGDRLGLIVFGEQAYPYVPLTFDVASVRQQLQQLVVRMAGDSTAIGDAIGLAVKSLNNRQGERILILLTDGEDNASNIPPLQAAKLAAKHKIKIYTIGIGSNGIVPIRDANGNMAMMEAHIDEKLLKEIAKLTGGLYARATSEMDLSAIYKKIDELEQHLEGNKVVMIRTSLHRWPLGLALVCLLGLLLIYRQYSYAV